MARKTGTHHNNVIQIGTLRPILSAGLTLPIQARVRVRVVAGITAGGGRRNMLWHSKDCGIDEGVEYSWEPLETVVRAKLCRKCSLGPDDLVITDMSGGPLDTRLLGRYIVSATRYVNALSAVNAGIESGVNWWHIGELYKAASEAAKLEALSDTAIVESAELARAQQKLAARARKALGEAIKRHQHNSVYEQIERVAGAILASGGRAKAANRTHRKLIEAVRTGDSFTQAVHSVVSDAALGGKKTRGDRVKAARALVEQAEDFVYSERGHESVIIYHGERYLAHDSDTTILAAAVLYGIVNLDSDMSACLISVVPNIIARWWGGNITTYNRNPQHWVSGKYCETLGRSQGDSALVYETAGQLWALQGNNDNLTNEDILANARAALRQPGHARARRGA